MTKVTTTLARVGVLVFMFSNCSNERNERAETSKSSKLYTNITDKVNVDRVDSVDLLFVIDKSKSMIEKQLKVRDQLKRLVTILTSGDKNPELTADGRGVTGKDFTPVKSLHLAVITSDLGLPGITNKADLPDPSCSGLGDDGWFQHTPHPVIEGSSGTTTLTCESAYPDFLEYSKDTEDVDQTATDFQCIVGVGPYGCGYEQQLEAALKALWPGSPTFPQKDAFDALNRDFGGKARAITFLGSTQGHGDSPAHASFLRGTPYNPTESNKRSVLAIVFVSDENDCSIGALGNMEILKSPKSTTLPPFLAADPVKAMKLNLRCWYDSLLTENQQNKYPIERYVAGFKALRGPDNENLIVFAAIVGVPVKVIKDSLDSNNDGDVSDYERSAYYESILNDPLMQEEEDLSDPKGGYLSKACILLNKDYSDNAPDGSAAAESYVTEAEPGRRFVEVARAFGKNGVVRSICEESFSPAMDQIIEAVSKQLGGVCFARSLNREDNGKVPCELFWEMPLGTDCRSDPKYADILSKPTDGTTKTAAGRAICSVHQIPVINPIAGEGDDPFAALDLTKGLGWYYDDFSAGLKKDCKKDIQRIAFLLSPVDGSSALPDQDPPAGVTVRLLCPVSFAITDK